MNAKQIVGFPAAKAQFLVRRRSVVLPAVLVLTTSVTLRAADRPRIETFDSNGVRISSLVQGEGEPVVLIHGWLSSATVNWALPGTMKLLAENNRVIAVDVRGHGLSAKPEEEGAYGPELVEDIVRLLDHMKIDKAHLVGYSMGGIITLNFVAKHPDRVLSATLGGMGWLRAGSPEQKVFAAGGKDGKPVGVCFRSLARLALTEQEIKSIDVPVQILFGDADGLKTGYVEPLKKVRDDWPVIDIRDANHLTCVTKPQFKNEIQKWLAAHRATAPQARSPAAAAVQSATFEVTTRRRVREEGSETPIQVVETVEQWDPARTAIVIVDMWDTHSCRSAAQRVVEMAPHVDRTIAAARERGVFIIHAPSDCMAFYQDAPQRQRAQAAPLAAAPVKFQWNHFNPDREGPLAERLEKGGCSCDSPEPCGPGGIVWKRQIDTIRIHSSDAITSDGQEVYNLLQERGIANVIVMGVHTNRCVLGRPFGIRQMVYLEKNVVLCRDLTDSFHRDPGQHFEGLERIVEHVERYWCPTISSESLTGQPEFRFHRPPAP